MAMYIQISRIYDALMLTLDDDVRTKLDEMHTKGLLVGATPALNYDDADENTAESDSTHEV